MKKLIPLILAYFLSCIFLSTFLYAYEAVVIVLEAPLLKEPKMSSIALQTLRSGERVYVPNEIGNLLATDQELPEFIQTYDRVGNIAYIPAKYIKIVTHEISEERMPIRHPISDPTDYRTEEPIPVTYPFDNTSYLRASISLSAGNNIKAPYDYNSAFNKQTFSAETGLKVVVSRKINFDHYDRYYFGFVTSINTTNNTLEFKNATLSKENRSVLKIGPILTFDAYKTENLRFTLGTGFTYNYHKSTITLSDNQGDSEERMFSGYSLSPFTNTTIQFQDILPLTDFIMGADLNLYLPHAQKTKDEIAVPVLWNSDAPNQIQAGLKPQVSFFLGIQVRY